MIKLTVEEKLQAIGIPLSHIQWLKETMLVEEPKGYFPKKDMEKQIVPVRKILGLGLRGEPGFSWWSHLMLERGTLNRIGDLVKRLGKLGLEEFKSTYMMEEFANEINILYYPDLDFYIAENGSHRTTMAKLTNVENMIADVTIMEKRKSDWQL